MCRAGARLQPSQAVSKVGDRAGADAIADMPEGGKQNANWICQAAARWRMQRNQAGRGKPRTPRAKTLGVYTAATLHQWTSDKPQDVDS